MCRQWDYQTIGTVKGLLVQYQPAQGEDYPQVWVVDRREWGDPLTTTTTISSTWSRVVLSSVQTFIMLGPHSSILTALYSSFDGPLYIVTILPPPHSAGAPVGPAQEHVSQFIIWGC